MVEITHLREASVKDLRSFIAERGFSTAGLLEGTSWKLALRRQRRPRRVAPLRRQWRPRRSGG